VRTSDRLAREGAERTRRARGPRPAPTDLDTRQRVTDMSLAPGGRYVVFNLVDDARLEQTRVIDYPAYVTSSGYVELTSPRGDAPPVKPTETFRKYRLGIVSVADGRVRYVDSTPLGKPVSWNAVAWSPDGERAVAWAGSLDHKDLWLCAVDVASASAKVLFREHEQAWVRGFRAGRLQRGDGQVTGFLPDGRTVFFLSERDGWYHLYTVSTEGGEPRQLTGGSFALHRPRLSRRGDRWYFLSSEADPLQRHLYTMPVSGGPRTRLTQGEGWVEEYAVSPDESRIAFTYGDPTTPEELFVMRNPPGAGPVRLTQSTTPEFRRYRWRRPEYVTFPDKDGWPVHAELYAPPRPDPARPGVIHVHGTGWTQGVAKRFGGYTPESRLELQFLADRGYTVLSVDYKGSRGYGRESRTSVYRRMGVPELESVDAAIDFLVNRRGVDRGRIGIFGHSYGGYLTLMALLTRPGTFAAGAAQAPVSDNAHSPAWFFTTRLLNVPWEDDEAYRRSSPIYYGDRLRDRLLILHGLQDLNVPIQDTFRLVQRFIELKRTGWDLAIYPVEPHILRQEAGRLDMLRRRFALFESVLKAPAGAGRTDRDRSRPGSPGQGRDGGRVRNR
jgi:dipeptidyl aminopeptidase/acylaminoacyl peptidase